MSKRHCICPVIGSGSDANPYRAKIADLANVNTSVIIPSKPDGSPKYLFAFCIFSASSIASVLAVSNTYVFPDYNLDGRMDGMESGARTGMVQSAQAFNLDGAGYHLDLTHADDDSYRSVIENVGKQFEPAYLVNNNDCGEVAA